MKTAKIIGLVAVVGMAGSSLVMTGCETAPRTETERAALGDRVEQTIREFKERDPSIQRFFDDAYGWAVFPEVTRGGAGLGGAHGRGQVFEQGRFIGFASVTQGTVGLQLGGQSFSQIIFFERMAPLDRFKSGQFAFSANASAVVVESGAGASASYTDGVAVFTKPRGGLMFEASIGGQNFGFERAE